MFWLRNKKIKFLLCTLNWSPGLFKLYDLFISSQSSGMCHSLPIWILVWMKNSVDPDQVASSEASWSWSLLFTKKGIEFWKVCVHFLGKIWCANNIGSGQNQNVHSTKDFLNMEFAFKYGVWEISDTWFNSWNTTFGCNRVWTWLKFSMYYKRLDTYYIWKKNFALCVFWKDVWFTGWIRENALNLCVTVTHTL